MKNIIISMMVLAMSIVLTGCRGSNSTYTTEPATTTAETQALTPTINNGNGPITTAPITNTTSDTTSTTETTGVDHNTTLSGTDNNQLPSPTSETKN